MRPAALRQTAVHALAMLPLAILLAQWGTLLTGGGDPRGAGLSAEPVDYTINTLGLWALRLLCMSLAITPLRQWTGWRWLAPWRRPLGLWCFAYASLHLSVYFVLDQLAAFDLLWREVSKRPFILFGMATWLLLLPLAVTSTAGWIRRIGARNWQWLHRAVYLAALLAATHFVMRVKGFQIEPWLYAAIVAVLLGARLAVWRRG